MSKEFTYAEAGVDRELRRESKEALKILEKTYRFSRYGRIINLPYGRIFPFAKGYLDLAIEGVGTKVLVAQLANKYDTIGIDGVALAVNDVIRSGARPLAIVDNIHAQVSDPQLIDKWMKGIVEGASEAECIVPGGEIGDVAEIIKGVTNGKSFDMVIACIGELSRDEIILGNDIKAGDVVIGLSSSGIHSNGISLARKILFKAWGGKYDPFDVPEGLNREVVYEVLEPMKIYVKPVLQISREHQIKGLVHITGDAYLKFNRLMMFSRGIGFEFNNFKPQPIFRLIQETAQEARGPITDEEMLRTFNMGWGFAIVTEENERDSIIDNLEKIGVEAQQIGRATDSKKIVAVHKGRKLELQ
ncbi:MAG: phosphoribosylformylglycinamidine cyclo-ligase [Candidatus Bathyarchaeota archaeon]|nr:phosphoribosylformylglycinamidine cyclo-ligase [Candidatus Bathyarchaeota archaeon]MDH5732538.1 phosphoribosylformylglycinamidine cyclo-ligase [Candidatus Bathyarchaeota archaeon]